MTADLAPALLTSTGLVTLTVAMHLAGLDGLTLLAGVHLRRFAVSVRVDRVVVPLGIVLGLFVLHGVEIWTYAVAYRLLGLLPDIEQALYSSASAYSTAGEAGPILPPGWRVVGALEAVNGMLLLGWSTAFLFRVLSRLLAQDQGDHPLPRGAIARHLHDH